MRFLEFIQRDLDPLIKTAAGEDDFILILLLLGDRGRHQLSHLALAALVAGRALPSLLCIVSSRVTGRRQLGCSAQFLCGAETAQPAQLRLQLLDLVNVVDHALRLLAPHLSHHTSHNNVIIQQQADKKILVSSCFSRMG